MVSRCGLSLRGRLTGACARPTYRLLWYSLASKRNTRAQKGAYSAQRPVVRTAKNLSAAPSAKK